MIDLTPIKPWIDKVLTNNIKFAVSTISMIGFDNWFDNQLTVFCNCTKTFSDGRRCTQTNDPRYAKELFTTVKIIEEFGGNDKDSYYTKLLNQHKINLEFEEKYGLEYSINRNKERKSTITRKKSKQVSIKLDTSPKKETEAEKRLKQHAAKINALMFKPKPINNDNTL